MTEAGRRRFARLQELFHQLVDLEAEERRRQLEVVRVQSAELYEQLLELLGDSSEGAATVDARERALDELAERPPAAVGHVDVGPIGSSGPTGSTGPRPGLPESVGPYRVLRVLGEGGMGRVYEAQQSEPLQRRVAVKVLRQGVDSREILARFQAERQALAVMDHPNIARVLDAGTTAEGRPWFAMELVDGVPITQWAGEHELDLEGRIEIILPVCDAIQHAHLKGVIHRDLKPSNVLVTVDDDQRPVPKVIDFGIAKAIEQPMLARTLATRLGELVGTPEYMSPEQASLGGVDVDTRSDVYSLGLVLYELLVGELPLRLEELRGVAFDEICRRIREDDTPRPSTRLDRRSSKEPMETSGVSAGVSVPSGRSWSRRLRTDLDAVLLKALAKDRDRRYESVAAFAGDLRRFLRHEAVEAAPPSWGYHAGKLLRRHRVAVTFSLIALASILAGLVFATVGLLRARRAEAEALAALRTSEETTDFVVGLFEASDPRVRQSAEVSARDLLERGIERIGELEQEPAVQARLLESLGDVSWALGAFDRAEPLLLRALELRSERAPDALREAEALNRLGGLYRDRSENQEAMIAYQRALAILEAADLDESRAMANALNGLGILQRRAGQLEQAARTLERAIALDERLAAEPSVPGATLLANLASVYQISGDAVASLETNRRALALFEQLLPADHPTLAALLVNIALSARTLGELGEAHKAAERALTIDRAVLPAGHAAIAGDLHGLGAVELRLGRLEAARAAFEEGLAIVTASLGAENYATTLHRASLGSIALAAGDAEAALGFLEPVLEQLEASDDGRAARHSVGYRRQQATALRRLGRVAEARVAIERGVAVVEELEREAERPLFRLQAALVALDLGEPDRAVELFEQANDLAGCDREEPCLLDQADTTVMRAHWHAQRGENDAALRSLELALDHAKWSAWMLEAPDLESLRRAPSARWQALEERLAAKVRRQREIGAAP